MIIGTKCSRMDQLKFVEKKLEGYGQSNILKVVLRKFYLVQLMSENLTQRVTKKNAVMNSFIRKCK